MSKLKTIIITSIGVISGILSIITFIRDIFKINIQPIVITIDLNWIFGSDNKILGIIILLVFIVCMFLLYVNCKKNRKIRNDILLHYNSILSILYHWVLCDKNDHGLGIPSELILEIKSLFQVVTNKPIDVQIKLIDVFRTKNASYMRTYWTTKANMSDNFKIEKIENNSDFFRLVMREKGYVVFTRKKKQQKDIHKIFNPKWNYKKCSCLVLPIKTINKDKKNTVEVVGFLYIDSSDANAFSFGVRKALLPILKIITGYLYLIIKLYVEDMGKDNNISDQ